MGHATASNRFDVFWNGTLIAKISRDGATLTNTSWLRTSLVVTGTGSSVPDRLSFREYDLDDRGVLIDDVRLTQR